VLIGGPVVAVNSNVRDKVSSATGLASTGEGRFRLVSGGVKLWKTEPVKGVGLGAFAQEYRKTLPRKQEVKTRVFISHTAPATVLAELGVIGFALMLVLLGVATAVLWRGSRQNAGAVGFTQWTILAILIGIFVHSLLYSAFFEDPYVWMLAAIGVAVGAAQPVQVREATKAIPVAVAATSES
jgi:putative inorganic carbon (hco3(-)) transporter